MSEKNELHEGDAAGRDINNTESHEGDAAGRDINNTDNRVTQDNVQKQTVVVNVPGDGRGETSKQIAPSQIEDLEALCKEVDQLQKATATKGAYRTKRIRGLLASNSLTYLSDMTEVLYFKARATLQSELLELQAKCHQKETEELRLKFDQDLQAAELRHKADLLRASDEKLRAESPIGLRELTKDEYFTINRIATRWTFGRAWRYAQKQLPWYWLLNGAVAALMLIAGSFMFLTKQKLGIPVGIVGLALLAIHMGITDREVRRQTPFSRLRQSLFSGRLLALRGAKFAADLKAELGDVTFTAAVAVRDELRRQLAVSDSSTEEQIYRGFLFTAVLLGVATLVVIALNGRYDWLGMLTMLMTTFALMARMSANQAVKDRVRNRELHLWMDWIVADETATKPEHTTDARKDAGSRE